MSILRYVKIRSFKSIRDEKIDLGQLNVFIGTNGAGKSNFLEAIGLLSSAVTGEVDYSSLGDRGVRLSSPEVLRSAFSNVKRKATFSIEGGFGPLMYRTNISSKTDASSSHPWRFHAETLRRGTRKTIAGRSNSFKGVHGLKINLENFKSYQGIIPVAKSLGVLTDRELEALSALKDYAIYAPSTPILRGAANDETRKSPLGLFGGGMAQALEDILTVRDGRKIKYIQEFFSLLGWFQSIGYRTPESSLQSSHIHTGPKVVSFKDKFMPRNFKELYAYDVSEGALYILFVLLLLAHEKSPNIFALDNVDNALNPSLVESLVAYISRVLKKNPEKQIFMTTHNPTTLDSLDLFDKNHRLFVVKRAQTGETKFEQIKPPTDFTREQWQEKFGYMKLSEIWLSGAIEGLNPPEGFK